MAVLKVNYFSEVLGMTSNMNVIMPQVRKEGGTFPVLYLFHGLSDNHETWIYKTSIVRYVEEYFPNLCVIMPAGDTSFYSDMVHGKSYYTHISEELSQIVSSMFPITQKRSETYIAGLSMGGYGALKIGLSNPEKFSKIASFSGVADTKYVFGRLEKNDKDNDYYKVIENVIGAEMKFPENFNPIDLAKKCMEEKNSPQMHLFCGKNDFLLEDNRYFDKMLSKIGYEHSYTEDEDFEHEWAYWDLCIKRILKKFKEGYDIANAN